MELTYNTNCCICGFELKHFSRSADPVKDGRCCIKCFWAEVVPARKAKIKQWEAEEAQQRTDYLELKEKSECPSGKICYKTKVDAEYALYTAKHEGKTTSSRKEKLVYFCRLCNQFHLSSHDNMPTWKTRNLPTNFNQKAAARYTPSPRKENW